MSMHMQSPVSLSVLHFYCAFRHFHSKQTTSKSTYLLVSFFDGVLVSSLLAAWLNSGLRLAEKLIIERQKGLQRVHKSCAMFASSKI